MTHFRASWIVLFWLLSLLSSTEAARLLCSFDHFCGDQGCAPWHSSNAKIVVEGNLMKFDNYDIRQQRLTEDSASFKATEGETTIATCTVALKTHQLSCTLSELERAKGRCRNF